MPKFKVTKCVDAFVHYETVVEAPDPKLARYLAESLNDSLEWERGDVSEYDHIEWDNIPPEEIPDEE